ncbi:MAG TPA: hypothetical protein DCE42_01555 [Myxococcales bacterium]|nr:hypothetical protein [Deltaproteobacteria bacterium]HAA53409.1 hypothetical protein [Myxococcales bacterium]|tara:strand:+ start:26328 stop:26849 length:522 start_codon:yes stop_codon:yes gene_type:complete
MSDSSRWLIRPASLLDAPTIAHFLYVLHEERLPTLFVKDTPPTIEDEIQFLKVTYSKPNSAVFLAFEGPTLAGMLDFHTHNPKQMTHTGEFGLTVSPDFRNQGLGTTMLHYLVDWAQKHPPLRRLELGVFSNNPDAYRLYKRFGFVEEGRKIGAVLVEDEYIDLILMAYTLNT